MNRLIKQIPAFILLIIVAIFAFIMLWACNLFGGELGASPYAIFPTKKNVNQGYGIQFDYTFENGLYPYASYDLNPVDFEGSDMGIVNLASVGGGYAKTWEKNKHGFRFFIDGGWYNPHNSDFERTEIVSSQIIIKQRCQKPVYVTTNSIYTTRIRYKDGFGGKVGLGYAYSINECLTLNLSSGYRYLELEREVNGCDSDQDFSGWLGMVGVSLKF